MILTIENFVNAGVALRNLVKQEINGSGCDDCIKYKRSL